MKNTKKLTMRLITVRFLKVKERKQILKVAAKGVKRREAHSPQEEKNKTYMADFSSEIEFSAQ